MPTAGDDRDRRAKVVRLADRYLGYCRLVDLPAPSPGPHWLLDLLAASDWPLDQRLIVLDGIHDALAQLVRELVRLNAGRIIAHEYRGAFETAVSHIRRTYRLGRKPAEDAAQETFVRLLEKPARWDPAKGTLQTWAGADADYRAKDHLRAEERRRRLKGRLDPDPPVAPPGTGLDGAFLAAREVALATVAHYDEHGPSLRQAVERVLGGATAVAVGTDIQHRIGAETPEGAAQTVRRRRALFFEVLDTLGFVLVRVGTSLAGAEIVDRISSVENDHRPTHHLWLVASRAVDLGILARLLRAGLVLVVPVKRYRPEGRVVLRLGAEGAVVCIQAPPGVVVLAANDPVPPRATVTIRTRLAIVTRREEPRP